MAARGAFGLFARKPVEEALAAGETSGFRRALGLIDLTSIGIAGIIGAGIFFFLGQEAQSTGPAVMVSLLVAGVAAVLAGFAYAEFASMIPVAGSSYSYAYATLGRLPAFVMGWLVLNAYAVGNMAVAIAWSKFFSPAMADLGAGLPRAITIDPAGGGVLDLPAFLIVVAITLLTLPRIRESTLFNNALVGLKLAIVLLIIVLGVLYIDVDNWAPFSPAGFSGVATSTAVLFFAYFGFDTVAAAAEEAKNPRRDLPLGILLSVGISMVLYILMAAAVTGMTPATEMPDPDVDPPVPAGFRRVGQDWAAGLITLGALVGLATVIYAFHLALSRIVTVMARDGFLPAAFTRLHPGTGTPWVTTLVLGFLTALGAGFLPIRGVLDMAVLATVFVYLLVAGGVIVLKFLRPDLPRKYSTHPILPALAIVLLLGIAFIGIPDALLHLVFWAWVGLGLILYGFYAHRRGPAFTGSASPETA